jgi:hypothetical protein
VSEARASVASSSCSGEVRSKAEPHVEAFLCPVSRTIGSKVDLITVKALLTGRGLRRLEGKAYRFCPEPNCDVVYFDREADSVFEECDLEVRVGQKQSDDSIPVCYCFDFSVADLRKDIAAEGETGIPAMIAAEVRAGHCACEVRNPQGTCCLGNVNSAVRRLQADRCGGKATP